MKIVCLGRKYSNMLDAVLSKVQGARLKKSIGSIA